MKKIILTLLATALIVSTVGCGKKEDNTSAPTQKPNQEQGDTTPKKPAKSETDAKQPDKASEKTSEGAPSEQTSQDDMTKLIENFNNSEEGSKEKEEAREKLEKIFAEAEKNAPKSGN